MASDKSLQGPQVQLTPDEDQALEASRQELIQRYGMNPPVSTPEGDGTTPPVHTIQPHSLVPSVGDKIVRGLMDGANEFSQMIWDSGNSLERAVTGHSDRPAESPLKIPESMMPDKEANQGIISNVTQFVAGMGIAGKALKSFKAIQGLYEAGKAGQFAVSTAAGALADFSVMDPHADRLSNLIERHPSLSNPVTQFLAAKPGDTAMEGRVKQALEGMGLGTIAEGFLQSLGAIKAWKAGAHEDADKILQDLADKSPAPGNEEFNPEVPREVVPTKKGIPLDPMTARPKQVIKVAPEELERLTGENLKSEEEFGKVYDPVPLNIDAASSKEDVQAAVDDLTEAYHKNLSGKQVPWEETRKEAADFADAVGANEGLMFQMLAADLKDSTKVRARLLAYRDMGASLSNRLGDLSDLVRDPAKPVGQFKDRAELLNAWAQQFEFLSNFQLHVKGMKSEFGRNLNALKIGPEADRAPVASMPEKDPLHGIDLRDEEQAMKLATAISAARGTSNSGFDLKSIFKLTRKGLAQNIMDTVNEYRINAMLSGLRTHAINSGSNLINTLYMPLEKFGAGALMSGTQAGRNQMLEAAMQYGSMITEFKDALKMSAKAFRLGDNTLDPHGTPIELRNSITSRAYNTQGPVKSAVINGLGTAVRVPTRMLMAEDEFFKQWNYRSVKRAEAWREAMQLKGTPEEKSALIQQKMDEAFDPSGKALDEKAVQYAREATFTQDINEQGWFGTKSTGETIQELANNHPMMRLVFPFVKAPTNIIRFVWNRTPGINLLRKEYAMDLMGRRGPEAKAKALAQMGMGAMLWGSAINAASTGTITGGGPKDPQLRKQWLETNQPYSLKVVNKDGTVSWIGYNRMDPFGMFFGLAADFHEVGNWQPADTREEFATAAAIALAKNLNSKSYLTGLTDLVEALDDPERSFKKFSQSFEGSFVPNLMRQTNPDPYLREVRDHLDVLMSRTPGLSDNVAPIRNALGELVHTGQWMGPDFLSPIPYKETGKDQLMEEMVRQMSIHTSAITPPPKRMGNVDLTQIKIPGYKYTAYDRYQELVGKVELGGKTLRERLGEFINTPAYQSKLTDGDFDYNGTRIDAIRSILGAYRSAAQEVLMKESPEFKQAVINDKKMQILTNKMGAQQAKEQLQQQSK